MLLKHNLHLKTVFKLQTYVLKSQLTGEESFCVKNKSFIKHTKSNGIVERISFEYSESEKFILDWL